MLIRHLPSGIGLVVVVVMVVVIDAVVADVVVFEGRSVSSVGESSSRKTFKLNEFTPILASDPFIILSSASSLTPDCDPLAFHQSIISKSTVRGFFSI